MVLVDPTLVDSSWYVDLPVEDRYLYLYLLLKSDNKIGTIEWNERLINFCINTKKHYTKDDVVRIYNGRIQEVPSHENTLIIVDYVRFNWLKGGRELDASKPLDKSILKALARYDLTVDKLNEMSKHKIKVKEVSNDKIDDREVIEYRDSGNVDSSRVGTSNISADSFEVMPSTGISDKDKNDMFNAFWSSYPSCSRKVNKKVVGTKFSRILSDADDAVSIFNKIMNGLDKWKKSRDWMKDGGQYICAPLVWLNQERWETDVEADPNAPKKVEAKPIIVKPEDWLLCSERCANCDGKCCLKGMSIPPPMWARPTTPEECPKFKKV